MIAEKSHTAQDLIEKISGSSNKVGFIKNDILTRALLFLENEGIPNNKVEDYKYCNLDAIIRKEFKNPQQKFNDVASINEHKIKETVSLVILNGNFSETLSDHQKVPGLEIQTFNNMDALAKGKIARLAKPESDGFVALNTAFSGNGIFIRVKKGMALTVPIHILYISTCAGEAIVNSRTLIELEENSSAKIIEQFIGGDNGKILTNALSEKFIGANAKLRSYIFENEGENGYLVNTNQVELAGNSFYENTTATLSGSLVRNNHTVILAGERSEAHLNGLFSSKGHQLVDNHTLMDHQVPNCESSELYKGIINDKSVGVFNGKIFVRKDAQKTNAYQSSKNILLSDDATINTKPQLEIYADDVKCSHGTSTGKIDEEALFYLNARGIGKESGRKLLLSSFAQEIINKIEVESLREEITNLFENEL